MLTKTYRVKPKEIERRWVVIDAKDKVLGRLATRIAIVLMGKDQPDWSPDVDNGAGVIVINCGGITVTGGKENKKIYYHHSQYPGGLTATVYKDKFAKDPTSVVRAAVKGMLPRNRLAARMLKRLKLYAGPEHRHEAQCPRQLEA